MALLTSFAAHAAVALENARLFEQARAAVAAADKANAELRARSEATERAAQAHDLLTDVLLHEEVSDVLSRFIIRIATTSRSMDSGNRLPTSRQK